MILPFCSILAQITWGFHLSIVVEVFWVVGSEMSIGYYLTIVQIHRLYLKFTACLAQQKFYFQNSVIISFTLLCSTPELPHFRYACTKIFQVLMFSLPCVITRQCYFFFMVTNVLLAYIIAGKMMLLKRLVLKVLFSFALRTSLFVVNTFYSGLICCKIFISMSQNIFTIHLEEIYSFTSLISSLPTTIPACGLIPLFNCISTFMVYLIPKKSL